MEKIPSNDKQDGSTIRQKSSSVSKFLLKLFIIFIFQTGSTIIHSCSRKHMKEKTKDWHTLYLFWAGAWIFARSSYIRRFPALSFIMFYLICFFSFYYSYCYLSKYVSNNIYYLLCIILIYSIYLFIYLFFLFYVILSYIIIKEILLSWISETASRTFLDGGKVGISTTSPDTTLAGSTLGGCCPIPHQYLEGDYYFHPKNEFLHYPFESTIFNICSHSNECKSTFAECKKSLPILNLGILIDVSRWYSNIYAGTGPRG